MFSKNKDTLNGNEAAVGEVVINGTSSKKIKFHPKHWQRLTQLLVVLGIAIVGVIAIVFSHAASPTITYSGFLSRGRPSVSYNVTVKYSGTLTASLSYASPITNASLFMYGPSGAVVTNGSGASPVKLTTTVSPGTYRFKVSGTVSRNRTGRFTLSITPPTTPPPVTAPSAPSGLTAAPASDAQVNLSWAASSDSNGTVAGYTIYRNSAKVGTSTTTTYSDTGLSASTSYSYYVVAYNTSNLTSADSNTATATTPAAPPSSTSSSGGVTASSSCSSPFVDSYFCQPVTNDSILSNSAAIVTSFVTSYQDYYGSVGVNQGGNGAVVYKVGANQALSTVEFDSANSTCSGHGVFTTMQVPIPSGAQPTSGSDHSIIIYQPSTGKDWEMWEFSPTPIATNTYGACAGAEIPDMATSNGVFPAGGSQLAATGIAYLATLITEQDVASGAINHAIAFAVPVCAGGFIAPARSGDCGGPGVIQEGQYLRFPSNLAMPSGLTSLGQMVFKAIQTYGMVDIDQAGAVVLQAEGPVGYDASGGTGDPVTASMGQDEGYQAVANLPWADLQAISPPAL